VNEAEGFFADIIHSYSRAQAIEDGVLVDVTETAREAGFKVPVALTRAVWEDCVAWDEADTKRHGVPQDESGRLWDVVWMAIQAVRSFTVRHPNADSVDFTLYRVPRGGRAVKPRIVRLVAKIGPGDEAEPVITILQVGED
jgi:hypothetical protein